MTVPLDTSSCATFTIFRSTRHLRKRNRQILASRSTVSGYRFTRFFLARIDKSLKWAKHECVLELSTPLYGLIKLSRWSGQNDLCEIVTRDRAVARGRQGYNVRAGERWPRLSRSKRFPDSNG